MAENIQFDVKRLRSLLVRQRVELVEVTEAVRELAAALDPVRRREVELGRIEEALKRLETGDYGYCVCCGRAIAPQRLQVDPAAALCITCANKH